MAGNAAGAAKATAKRLEKAAARKAEREGIEASQNHDDGSLVVDGSLDELPMDGQGVRSLVPLATRAVREGLRGRDKKGLAARAKLGLDVLQLVASIDKKGKSQADAAAIAVLEMMRRRAAGAVDAAILPAESAPVGGEPVALPAPCHPHQQPDEHSDPASSTSSQRSSSAS